ncbi:High mobility group b protein [Thalictrum thalictroides]|uniref:High mobility group b protein n=1 Tax=Thalictrum thalictroides TaxID=46969 RepID=A0A7J6VR41_THATH|nr:High mobility group b protein [Thalictrum thalictroides]
MKIVKRRGVVKKDKKEALKPVDDRKVGKRKAAVKADKMNTQKSKKETSADKDPNKPKRPPTAFFVFLEDFRKTYKQQHPTVKAVSVVGKAGGEKWKSMSSGEKHPYVVKAAKRKLDYERLMNTYSKKKEVSMADDAYQESDRAKSEVSDEADEEISGEGGGNEVDG